MNRFKVSKYKNAATKLPKREEWLFHGLNADSGGIISSGAEFSAFGVDSKPGLVSIYPVNVSDVKPKQPYHLPAHSDVVTDICFSPFNDWLLASCSHDGHVKLWELPPDGDVGLVADPVVSLSGEVRSVDNVQFHPAASDVLATSVHDRVKIWDVESQECIFDLGGHDDAVLTLRWSNDGSVLATTCRDKKLRIVDPRVHATMKECDSHQNQKGSKVQWLSDNVRLITTGFSRTHQSEVYLWDIRQFGTTVSSMTLGLTGIVHPLLDSDTNMLFLAAKGEYAIGFYEVHDKDPFLSPCSNSNSSVQTVAACLVPKRGLDVMHGEINRLLVLARDAVLPIPYIVPRKTYRDFHADIFPDTAWDQPAMTATQWINGANTKVKKHSLNPAARPTVKYKTFHGRRSSKVEIHTLTPQHSVEEEVGSDINGAANEPPTVEEVKPSPVKPTVQRQGSLSRGDVLQMLEISKEEAAPTKPCWTGFRTSKFKHLQAEVMHKSLHIHNLRNVDGGVNGESGGFAANEDLVAVALKGAGGLVGIFSLNKPGRLPDTSLPAVENGSLVTDFEWDPFDNHRLAVACDDAKIRIWLLPHEGVTDTLTVPSSYLKGHTEKIYLLHWHPTASDVLVSASYDMTVRIWNVAEQTEELLLDGHTDQVFSLSWSSDGKYLATLCKDQVLRVYNPRSSVTPVQEGTGPEGTRGGRVIWVLDGYYLLVSGFSKGSERQISLYSTEDITSPLTTVGLDTSPSILSTVFDEDSSTVFLTGKGDTTVFAFEVTDQSPYFYQLASYHSNEPHHGFTFLPKAVCHVMDVEFARGLKLTDNTIEPVSFRVPRIQKEYFHDDLFPDTRVTWKPLMSASEWLHGGTKTKQQRLSLKPDNVKSWSAAEKPSKPPKPKYDSSAILEKVKTEKEKETELIQAMHSKLEFQGDVEHQAEGVDSDEWSD